MIFKKLYRHLILKFITNPLDRRITELEKRTLNHSFLAIDNIGGYLQWSNVSGDYLEFGVYQGSTFSYAYKTLSRRFDDMRFFAFDSFQGLPELEGVDALETSSFHEHQFSCSKDDFVRNIRRAGVEDMTRVHIIEGWFDQTLTPEKAKTYGVNTIAAAWIDVDLYESTLPVLRFITPYLAVGSVIVFDDWRCFKNLPDFGEQRACQEWLADNPQIELRELFSFGWHGIAFTVSAYP